MYSIISEDAANNSLTTSVYELQSDILGEKLTDNPLMTYNRIKSKNKELATTQSTIVSAINEIVDKIANSTVTTDNSLSEMYSVLGNISLDATLKDKILNHGTVIDILLRSLDHTISGYEDVISVEEDNQENFILTHQPLNNTNPKMYVNGIRYLLNKDFTYSKEYNRVTWINSNILKLKTSDIVMFEYDYLDEETI